MTENIIKFVHRVNERNPDLSVDALVELWEKIDLEEQVDREEEPKTCKHKFRKGKKADTPCTIKVKGSSDYCSKHKK